MDWKKLIGLLFQLAAMYQASVAGEHNIAAKVSQGNSTMIAGVPAKSIGYSAGAATCLAVGAGLVGSGGKKKRDPVTDALRTIAADAAETGEQDYQKKVADLSFAMQSRRKSTVK